MWTMKIDFIKSPKMGFCFCETKIWYAWLESDKDAMIVMLTKIHQLYYMLYKKIWMPPISSL